MQHRQRPFVLIAPLLIVLLSCNLFSLPSLVIEPAPSSAPEATPTRVAPGPPAAGVTALESRDVEELLQINVYERASPAVVNVRVSGGFLGQNGSGAGFVYDQQGHIITNNHVIERARQVVVTFADGMQTEARIIGRAPEFDLAVIKVNVPPDVLVPLELGDSSSLQVGQRAIAIGNPLDFDRSLTIGIISGLDRAVIPMEGMQPLSGLIQTDAAINPGNSGGPLLDSQGKVIGVNTLIFSRARSSFGIPLSSGIGFAIPVDTVKRVVPRLIK